MRPNQAPELIVFSLLQAGVLPVAGAQSVKKPAALVADDGVAPTSRSTLDPASAGFLFVGCAPWRALPRIRYANVQNRDRGTGLPRPPLPHHPACGSAPGGWSG